MLHSIDKKCLSSETLDSPVDSQVYSISKQYLHYFVDQFLNWVPSLNVPCLSGFQWDFQVMQVTTPQISLLS